MKYELSHQKLDLKYDDTFTTIYFFLKNSQNS